MSNVDEQTSSFEVLMKYNEFTLQKIVVHKSDDSISYISALYPGQDFGQNKPQPIFEVRNSVDYTFFNSCYPWTLKKMKILVLNNGNKFLEIEKKFDFKNLCTNHTIVYDVYYLEEGTRLQIGTIQFPQNYLNHEIRIRDEKMDTIFQLDSRSCQCGLCCCFSFCCSRVCEFRLGMLLGRMYFEQIQCQRQKLTNYRINQKKSLIFIKEKNSEFFYKSNDYISLKLEGVQDLDRALLLSALIAIDNRYFESPNYFQS